MAVDRLPGIRGNWWVTEKPVPGLVGRIEKRAPGMDCEAASKSPANSRPVIDSKKSGRSRISNGSALLPGVDGRSAWVRRCKDVINAHIADLGGLDNCSAAEHSIVRRAAVLTTELEV